MVMLSEARQERQNSRKADVRGKVVGEMRKK
jgi:hypothetical protein